VRGLSLIRSRFFLSLYASFTAILLVTSVLVGTFVAKTSVALLRSDQEESMKSFCRLLEPQAREALARGEVGALAGSLAALRESTGVRITLVLPDGKVIEDTHEDPGLMDDHRLRPEVLDSLATDFGVSRRFSRTVRFEMLYVAKALRAEGKLLGHVRVSLPLRIAREELAEVRSSVLIGTGLGFLLALVLGVFLARRFTIPLAEVTTVAKDLSAGRLESRVRMHRSDEIGVLAQSLDQLADEVTSRIAAMSQEDAKLRAMLSGMIEAVFAVDEQDRIAFCNQAARDDFFPGKGLVEGERLWEVAPIAALDELLEAARSGRGDTRAEIEVHRDGRERTLVVHAGAFLGGGRRGVVVVSHDITELRKLERIRRDFVANVSHELKTPLAAIKGFVETLLTGALHDDDNNERFLRRIDVNVERLNHLVSDLLELARVESKEQGFAAADVPWADVVDEVARRNEEILARKGLALRRDVDPSHAVRGDRESMVRILENLIDNAAKYTAEGHVSVRTRLDGDACVLEVSDTGIGIPGRDLPRVFERFYRVDKARSSDVEGTGLGLSIVRNLVRKLNGDVRVESEVGVGSTFSVELPAAR